MIKIYCMKKYFNKNVNNSYLPLHLCKQTFQQPLEGALCRSGFKGSVGAVDLGERGSLGRLRVVDGRETVVGI